MVRNERTLFFTDYEIRGKCVFCLYLGNVDLVLYSERSEGCVDFTQVDGFFFFGLGSSIAPILA